MSTKSYLAYSKCSMWVDSELCKVNSKLYKTGAKILCHFSQGAKNNQMHIKTKYKCSSQVQRTNNNLESWAKKCIRTRSEVCTIKDTCLMYASFTATQHFHIFYHPWI